MWLNLFSSAWTPNRLKKGVCLLPSVPNDGFSKDSWEQEVWFTYPRCSKSTDMQICIQQQFRQRHAKNGQVIAEVDVQGARKAIFKDKRTWTKEPSNMDRGANTWFTAARPMMTSHVQPLWQQELRCCPQSLCRHCRMMVAKSVEKLPWPQITNTKIWVCHWKWGIPPMK